MKESKQMYTHAHMHTHTHTYTEFMDVRGNMLGVKIQMINGETRSVFFQYMYIFQYNVVQVNTEITTNANLVH